jgi:hypothetical protein
MTKDSHRGLYGALLPLLGIAIVALLQGCATNPNPYRAGEYLILLEQARKIGVVPTLEREAPVERPAEPLEKKGGGDKCSQSALGHDRSSA